MIMEIQSFSQSVRALAQAENKKEIGPIGRQVSELAHLKNAEKKQQETTPTDPAVNIDAGKEPQSLILQASLTGINEALQEAFGETTVQIPNETSFNLDPEATAESIVSSSTAVFSEFQEQHPELSQEEALSAFSDTIKTGLETGFSEAKDILASLNVLLNSDTEATIDETYVLIQEKLQLFIDSFSVNEEPVET